MKNTFFIHIFMKKLLLALLSGTLLFSGCSFGGDDAQEQMEAAQEKVQESPEELFYSLAQKNLDYSVETMKEYIPSKEVFEKGEKTFSIDGNVSLEGTPAQVGNVSFEIKGDSKGDYSDTENAKALQTLSFNGEISGAVVSGKANGSLEMRIVDNALFASLTSLVIESPSVPQAQIDAMVGPFIGKWFGNTFEEINALQAEDPSKTDIQKMLAGTPMGVLMWEVIEDEQKNMKDYVTFVSFKEEKNGIFYFEVSYKAEKIKELTQKFLASFGAPQELSEEMEKSLEKLSEKTFVIGYSASDESYVSTVSPAISQENQEIIAGKENTMTYSNDEISLEIWMTEKDSMIFFAKDGKFSTTYTDENEAKEIIKGAYSDAKFTFEMDATEPTFDDEEEVEKQTINGSFAKSGNAWAGEITNTADSSIVVKISNAAYSKEKASLTVNVEKTVEGADKPFVWGPINFNATIGEISEVSVEKPENFSPFQDIETLLNPAAPQAEETENNEVKIVDEAPVF